MAEPIRILVVDDHTVLRSALCDVLRIEPDLTVVDEAGDGEEAVEKAVANAPQVVILDIEMPGQEVFETVRQLRDRCPGTRVLILSMYQDPYIVRQLLRLGVDGYLHKSATRETLLSAIRTADTPGPHVIVSVSRDSLTASTSAPAPAPTLSVRETEVIGCVAEAMSNRQIAGRLGITEGTVKRHLRNIFDKLGAVSRIDAVNKAVSGTHHNS